MPVKADQQGLKAFHWQQQLSNWQSSSTRPVNFRVVAKGVEESTVTQSRLAVPRVLQSLPATREMSRLFPTCAILADRHLGLAEGVRGLLEVAFDTVYVVADQESLCEGARRLSPTLIVLDLPIAGGDVNELLDNIRELSPDSRVIVLTVHDQATVAKLALAAGANSVVLKRCVSRDLVPAIDAVLLGKEFVSPYFGLTT